MTRYLAGNCQFKQVKSLVRYRLFGGVYLQCRFVECDLDFNSQEFAAQAQKTGFTECKEEHLRNSFEQF